MGLHFVPFPGPSSSGVWRARSLQLIASPAPAAPFSGCTAGAPSQADGDRPEPQEVSVSKEACLQFGSLCLSGATMAHFRPSGSGCLSPEGDGLQLANSVPSFVLCAVLAVSYVRAFRMVAIPQPGLLAQVSSLWLHSGHLGLILKMQCSPHLPAQPPLASGGCSCLCCFSAGGLTVGLVICGF